MIKRVLLVLLLVLTSPISAQNLQELSTVPGILSWMFNIESIDYDSLVIIIFLVALVALAILASAVYATLFWIRMLSDALNRKFENENDKIAWVIVITFTHGLGAMLYYKMVNDKTKKKLRSPPTEPSK